MGWQERLKEKVNGAGWTVSTFQNKLAEFDVRGSSYGSVWAYLNDSDAKPPPMEFFEIAAEVLAVRPAWLAFDEGAATEEEERKRRWEEEELARQQALDAGEHELKSDAVLPSGSLLDIEDNAARHCLFKALEELGASSEGWARLQQAIRGQLETLRLPNDGGPAYDDYVAAVALAIRRYARASKEEESTDG